MSFGVLPSTFAPEFNSYGAGGAFGGYSTGFGTGGSPFNTSLSLPTGGSGDFGGFPSSGFGTAYPTSFNNFNYSPNAYPASFNPTSVNNFNYSSNAYPSSFNNFNYNSTAYPSSFNPIASPPFVGPDYASPFCAAGGVEEGPMNATYAAQAHSEMQQITFNNEQKMRAAAQAVEQRNRMAAAQVRSEEEMCERRNKASCSENSRRLQTIAMQSEAKLADTQNQIRQENQIAQSKRFEIEAANRQAESQWRQIEMNNQRQLFPSPLMGMGYPGPSF
eukprot:NODE_3515_length_953_cov_51.128329_g3363_i0.p1 GENE.NODE_3515_length_953_cov_51.128329_g3363_i0~~NODE_3515_length_953_cov_51.128329_g3363_i0.p1  ORF type:complete len:275 (+),score=55.36 NODE_3515_length_953_cov_51.128329_g3363_i0:61-885(+)